jgi:putative intracellular protease/amidase
MGTKTVHCAVYDTMADWEVGFATTHINSGAWQQEPGRYRVLTVGETDRTVTTMGGFRIAPDVVLDDLRPDDSAMLILPGADTWLTGGNTAFARKAREFFAAGTPVAAICGATAGLAVEGLLDDREHTSNALEFLAAFGYGGGERYVDAPVVTDGDLITATATAPIEFARAVFQHLDLYDADVLDAWYKLYGLGDPAGYHELVAATGAS